MMKVSRWLFLVATCFIVHSKSMYVAYFPTWSSKWPSDPANADMAKFKDTIPCLTHLMISFAKPDMKWDPNAPFWSGISNTGLLFNYKDWVTVKGAIAATQAKGVKVMLAVGGATYHEWGNMDVSQIAAFVNYMNIDGVDIDFELQTQCSLSGAEFSCTTDAQYLQIVRSLRSALPRPKLLSVPVWSVGAYGHGNFLNSKPITSNTGRDYHIITNAGSDIDFLTIMAYDAGDMSNPAGSPTMFDPKESLRSHKAIYSGPISLGLEVPPEAWGGHVLTIAETVELTKYTMSQGGSGMMLWVLYAQGQGAVTYEAVSAAVCANLATHTCNGGCNGDKGYCVATNVCNCLGGYTGNNCETPPVVVVCNPPCSSHGSCQAGNICFCNTGWTGNICDQPNTNVCNPPCSQHGNCQAGNTCLCSTGWSGATCEIEDTAPQTKSSNTGLIIGSVFGSSLFVIAVAIIALSMKRRKRNTTRNQMKGGISTNETQPQPGAKLFSPKPPTSGLPKRLPEGLPKGWATYHDDQGRPYYVSPAGVSQWDPPSRV